MKYTVKRGDTLQFISMKFYGSFKRWPEIWERNQHAILARQNNEYCKLHKMTGPDWLFEGTELNIDEDIK